MFKCFECGHLFERGEERKVVEAHGEEYLACPVCGEAYEETVICNRCGGHHFENELYNGLCMECVGKALTLDNMMKYLPDSGIEADFYIDVFYKSSASYVSDELLDLARCGFKKAVFNDTLNEAEARKGVPTGYESPAVAMMRAFICDDYCGVHDFAEWLNKKEEGN